MIGDQFDCFNEVTGVSLAFQPKQDKISVWIRHGNEPEIKERMRADIIKICELPPDVRLDFLVFFPN